MECDKDKKQRTFMSHMIMPSIQVMKLCIRDTQLNSLVHLFSTILMMRSLRVFLKPGGRGKLYSVDLGLLVLQAKGIIGRWCMQEGWKRSFEWKRKKLGSTEGSRWHGDYSLVQCLKMGSLKVTNDKGLSLKDIEDEASLPSGGWSRWKQLQI